MFAHPALLATALLLWAAPHAVTATSSVSYLNLTDKRDAREFFASGGKTHRFDRVHLHLSASVVHARPMKVIRNRRGHKRYLFRNRSVPLVVQPGNVYVRKIRQRTRPGDSICVKGTVNREPQGGKDRYALFVHSVKKTE